MTTIREMLEKYRLDENAQPPVRLPPKCAVCQDTGYLRQALPVEHPLFGKVTPCPQCTKPKAAGTVDEYGLQPGERAKTFGRVEDTDASIVSAKHAIKMILERGWGWLYLFGPYGVAKTLLLKTAVAEYLRMKAAAGCYVPLVDILDEVREAYDSKTPSYEANLRLRRWGMLPLLAVDEFEKVNATEWVEERRFQIFNQRYEAAINGYGITLFASNVPPHELKDKALASRVSDKRFRVIKITAGDYRQNLGDTQ